MDLYLALTGLKSKDNNKSTNKASRESSTGGGVLEGTPDERESPTDLGSGATNLEGELSRTLVGPDMSRDPNVQESSLSRTLAALDVAQNLSAHGAPSGPNIRTPTSILVNRTGQSHSNNGADQGDPWGLNRSQAALFSSLEPLTNTSKPTMDAGSNDPTGNPYGLPPQIFEMPLAGVQDERTVPTPPKIPRYAPVAGISFGETLTEEKKSTPGRSGDTSQKLSDESRRTLDNDATIITGEDVAPLNPG